MDMVETDAENVEEEVAAVQLAHEIDSGWRTADIGVDSPSTTQQPVLSFADMGLSVDVLKGLRHAGFLRPSPVQINAIPLGCLGVDLIVQAKSGTGKTVVFSVITLEAVDVAKKTIQVIVISPTREIAFQSATVIRQLGHFIKNLHVQLFVGGISLAEDIKNLENCHIAVGTPGRLKYLMKAFHMNCEHIRMLVLDEADLLLRGGASSGVTDAELLAGKNTFPSAINFIWWSLPESKQVLALSATFTDHILNDHLPRYMRSPAVVRLSPDDPSLKGVRQFYTIVKSSVTPTAIFKAKVKVLLQVLKSIDFKQCIVFSNYHNSAEQLCEVLRSSGWPVGYISSGLDQKERFRAFNSLRAFQCRVLVSTDLTSRGVDAENVNLVVNLEVPWQRDIYLHRIGRAGRFGSYGASILLLSDAADDMKLLRRIEEPNSTPILRLPEPIPVDLAKPNCQADLSKLVTVTKLSSLTTRHGPPSPTSFDYIQEEEKEDVSPKKAKPDGNNSTVHRPAPGVLRKSLRPREDESLAELLKKYVAEVNKKPPISLNFVSTAETDLPFHLPHTSSPNPRMEQAVLRELSEFLHQPPTEATVVETKATVLLKERESTWRMEQPQSMENAPKEAQPDTVPVSTDTQSRTLTVRQMALWGEYWRLIGWKNYFYQAWWNASREYKVALDEYKAIAQPREVPKT